MPRSPDDRVVRDSNSELWRAVREGLVWSTDVLPNGQLRPSLAPTPETSQAWAQAVQANTPFGRQTRPDMTLSIVPPSPNAPPTPTPPRRAALGDISNTHVNVLQRELAKDDRKRAAEGAALRKIREGMRELELAREM